MVAAALLPCFDMWKFKVTLLVLSCVVAFGIAELLARLILVPPQVVTVTDNTERQRFTLPVHPEQGHVYVETDTGRRLRANADITIENHALSRRRIRIQTNSLGYRNREVGPKQGKRLLFLGDSITFGDYLDESDTFVRQVESLAQADGHQWETVNAGVGAIGLKEELSILVETGLSIEPDVVVLGFYLNDFQASPGFYSPRLPSVLDRSRLLVHAATVLSSWGSQSPAAFEVDVEAWRNDFESRRPIQWGDHRTSEPAFNAFIAKSFDDWGGAWSEQAWNNMQPYFVQLKRMADQQGFDLLIVAFPVSYQIDAAYVYDFPQQKLKQIGQDLDAPVIDILPVLREEYHRGKTRLFYDHCHHTPYANRVIAQAIYDGLTSALESDPE